uniref:AlaDh_PNT_N domain-containing protein n=1 Tax=Heterorhabditis bacteriophora TaxID=37862 RepID=A0A1I7X9Y8_HETBA
MFNVILVPYSVMQYMYLFHVRAYNRHIVRGFQSFIGRGVPTIGIRRETINAWERRAPLAPVHVKKLTKSGVNVLIQPSNRRAFPIQDYIAAGAIVREDLSDAQLIISVKQVPVDHLIPNKTYAFFSHTIKAQQDNMEMLDTILQRKIRLIDYEKIVDKRGKRLVMFGKWAGNAGFIDILHGLGLRLLALGHHTPFLHMGLAHNYSDSHMAINALRDIGYEIALDKMPRSLGPLVFVFTGSGNVSRGAQELFEHLPHEYVDAATLPKVAQKGRNFDSQSGCLVCSIDNMPAQMPIEATEQFGNLLYPYMMDMLNCATDQHFDRLVCRDEVKGAIITTDGRLTPNYEYIAELRSSKTAASSHKSRVMGVDDKKVLLLGAGMVSGPFADFYSKQPKVQLTVATESRHDGQKLASSENISSIVVDVNREHDVLNSLIRDHDLVVSLLPYTLHPMVAKMCIKNKTDMVTSSYVSPELQALDEAAKLADVTIMNEAGLDPGIDHMLAMECFDSIREHGGNWSPKGVLTALMNPAKYLQNGKIVDIPSGKVVNHLYPMDFMPGFNLIGFANRDSTKYSDIYGLGSDCKTLIRGTLRYKVGIYRLLLIFYNMLIVFFKGFVETVKALDSVGLLNSEATDVFNSVLGPDLTWKQLVASLLNQKLDIFPDSLRNIAAERVGKTNAIGMKALNELGLFSDIVVDRHGSAIDTLASYLSKVLAFKENERDIVILNHDIGVQLQGGNSERHRISMVAYGEVNGFSAMARTVGYTCAIVSNMVLQGEIQRAGVLRPIQKEIYRPALKRLEDFNIHATHTITAI